MTKPEYERVFERAIRLLSRRSRSVAELRERLTQKSPANTAIIEQVLARLLELGYLNDKDFATNYATNRINTKAVGRARLRRSLINKKVSAEIAEETLTEVYAENQEAELCQQALDKYLRIHGQPDDIKESKKIFAYLIRLGFPYDLVMSKLRKIADIEPEE